jgi:hypothetical protein
MAADIEAVERIVTAGSKILYAPESRKMLISGLKGDKPVSQKLAMEVVGLIKIMYDKSKKTMPPSAIPAATAMLIYEVADFMKQAGLPVTMDDIKQAMVASMKLLTMAFQKEMNAAKAKRPSQPPQQPAPQPAPQASGLIGMAA